MGCQAVEGQEGTPKRVKSENVYQKFQDKCVSVIEIEKVEINGKWEKLGVFVEEMGSIIFYHALKWWHDWHEIGEKEEEEVAIL